MAAESGCELADADEPFDSRTAAAYRLLTMRPEEEMPRIKHIAIFPKDQFKMIEFYRARTA